MASPLQRRAFLASTAAGLVTIVPRHVLGGPGHVAPNDKITLAHIGMGTQSFRELGALLAQPELQIVAVCDPNTDSHDYLEWGKDGIRNTIRGLLGKPDWRKDVAGCPGGREVGRAVVDGYYAARRGGERFRGCASYADFRELLANEKDVDAVKIMTPDHLHAAIALAAMQRGKHVLMHKPIANRMAEGRKVFEAAEKAGIATHLLAYGSGRGNGQIARQIKAGAIGTLREIHNWSNRPVWPQYAEIPRDRPAPPEGFDWDLWLGPAEDRPYHPHYTHTVFRGWYDFGGGAMADMGIYSLWPVFAALDLPAAVSAEALATHACTAAEGVCRTIKNDYSYPAACTLRFRFAARGAEPGCELFWYDGGMRPRLPAELEALGIETGREGILFVGDRGAIVAGFHGQDPRLVSGGKSEPLAVDAALVDAKTRHRPWLEEIKGGGRSPGSFLHARAITETVNLGSVALRWGGKVVFDSPAMKIANAAGATKYLTRQYRAGWEL